MNDMHILPNFYAASSASFIAGSASLEPNDYGTRCSLWSHSSCTALHTNSAVDSSHLLLQYAYFLLLTFSFCRAFLLAGFRSEGISFYLARVLHW